MTGKVLIYSLTHFDKLDWALCGVCPSVKNSPIEEGRGYSLRVDVEMRNNRVPVLILGEWMFL